MVLKLESTESLGERLIVLYTMDIDPHHQLTITTITTAQAILTTTGTGLIPDHTPLLLGITTMTIETPRIQDPRTRIELDPLRLLAPTMELVQAILTQHQNFLLELAEF